MAAREDSYAPLIFTSSLPILLLSGVRLRLGLAPHRHRSIAAVDALSYAVGASRAVFLGHLGDPTVVRGVALRAVLAILAIFLGSARDWAGCGLTESLNSWVQFQGHDLERTDVQLDNAVVHGDLLELPLHQITQSRAPG